MMIGGLLTSLAAVGFGQRDIAWITSFLALLPIGALVSTSFARISMTCGRQVSPARTEIGRPTTVLLDLEMRSPFVPALVQFEDVVDPRLGQRPRFDSHRIAGRWHRRVNYPLTAHTRGVFETGPFLVRSTDPFGLTYIDRAFQARNEVIVTPRIFDLAPVRLGAGAGMTGEETPHRIGISGHDDALVREHRHGDDLRRVHWRSTAKQGELMVRREEQSLDPSVTILLDSRHRAYSGPEGTDRFEWAVSASASIANHLIGRGYRVRIIDADGPRVVPQHDDATASREEVLLAMTTQQLSRRDTLDHALTHPACSLSGQSLIVLLGDAGVDDIAHILGSRAFGQRGWVFLNGRSVADDLVRSFASHQWRVQVVSPGLSVPTAWSAMGGLA